MKRFIFGILFLLSVRIVYAQEVLNVYAWGGYIPRKIIHAFEKETGIRVNLSEYGSNEELYAKLKAYPKSVYDVIIPSSYYVKRMANEGMLEKLDLSKLLNRRYMAPEFMNRRFDPKNQYSLPFLWGTTAILVDRRYWDPKKINSWRSFWRIKKLDQILMYDDVREVFSVAMLRLGYSLNDRNTEHVKQAYQLLRKLLPNIRIFNTSAAINIYADSDVTIGMAMSGDAFLARKENPNLVYIYPKEGFSIWIDCLAVPLAAPHKGNAHRFINFMLRPQVSAQLMKTGGFASPNRNALKYLPQAWKNDSIINPSSEILKRGQLQESIGPAKKIYQQYWYRLKLGD